MSRSREVANKIYGRNNLLGPVVRPLGMNQGIMQQNVAKPIQVASINPNQFISRQKDNWHPTSKENPDYAYTGENPKDRNISWNTERFPFGSTQRLALIGNKAKMVGNKFINHSKEDIVLGIEHMTQEY